MLSGSGGHRRLPQSQSLSSGHNKDCVEWLNLLVLLVSDFGGEPSDASAGRLSFQMCPVYVFLDDLECHKNSTT